MIAIIGDSASGKTTLIDNFIQRHPEYSKIVTYTTRPIREGEQEGIDYHFVSDNTFNELSNRDFFVEQAEYRDWKYGVPAADCNIKNAIAIVTPTGFRTLKKLGYNPMSIYIYVDRRSRLIQLLLRGDNIDESYRRNLSDVGMFDGITNEVDYVIENSNYHMTPEQTVFCLEKILETHVKAG